MGAQREVPPLCASTCQANHSQQLMHGEANAYGPETTCYTGGDGGQRTVTQHQKGHCKDKAPPGEGDPKDKPQLPGTQQGFRYLEDEVQASRHDWKTTTNH